MSDRTPIETPLMNIAKEENRYCFDDAMRRVEAVIREFGTGPVMVGGMAAILADAFEHGYAAAVFDTMAVMRGQQQSTAKIQ